MGEGHVYLCGWRVEDDTYHIWVRNRPRLRAQGDSIDDASEELVNLICEATGDGEAALDLDPPPGDESVFVALVSNSSWYLRDGMTREECAALYQGGICDACCLGVGRRTGVPLPIGLVGEGDIQFCWATFCDAVIASDRVRDLLRPGERSAFEWRPVDQPRRVRRTFFELIAKEPLPYVADRKERVQGWRCQECGRRTFGIQGKFNPFVAANDVPRPTPKILAIASHRLQLALPVVRWRNLRGQPGAKGVIAKPVTMLPRSRIWRRPRLRDLTRTDIRAARKHFEWQLRGGKWSLLPQDVPIQR